MSFLKSRQYAAWVAAFDHACVASFATPSHDVFDDGIFVVAVDDVEIRRSGQQRAGEVERRKMRTDEENTAAALLCGRQQIEAFDRRALAVAAQVAEPRNCLLYTSDAADE